MKTSFLAALLATAIPLTSYAGPYVLSADGATVVRLVPQGTVSASALTSAMLTSGWTAQAGNIGTASITSYNAGYKSGNGGAEIKAMYNNGKPLAAGQSLEWVQVVTTNAPLGGASSPYLDNAGKPGEPFYTYTAANRTPGLPATQLNFYDYSKRAPGTVTATTPINWSAQLFPVIRDASKQLIVQDGVSWGWDMKKATVGKDSGVFLNATPSSAVTTGLGTSSVAWGLGSPSALTYTGYSFDTAPDTAFKIGHLTFNNGTIFGGGADTIDLKINLSFDNIAEKNFSMTSTLRINNTSNTDDPVASADTVSIDGYNFTFNVLEGYSAGVDLWAKLTTGLSALPTGAVPSGADLYSPTPFDPDPVYTLTFAGFSDPTDGGFIGVTAMPEPGTIILLFTGCLLMRMRRRTA